MKVVAVVLMVAALTVSFWLIIGQIRGIGTGSDYETVKSLPRPERRRMAKLIRSEEVISHQHDWKNGEINARFMIETTKRFTSPRYVAGVVLAMVAGVIPEGRENRLILELFFVVVFGLGYLWARQMQGQIERTAALNVWRVGGPDGSNRSSKPSAGRNQ